MSGYINDWDGLCDNSWVISLIVDTPIVLGMYLELNGYKPTYTWGVSHCWGGTFRWFSMG